MGPVLLFRGARNDEWRLSALVALPREAAPPLLTVGGVQRQPVELQARRGHRLWRVDFGLPLSEHESSLEYSVSDRRFRIALPPRQGALRLAYTACNGSADEPGWSGPSARNAGWDQLAGQHARRPFHLLLQGGDQLYADDVWRAVPALAAWHRLPRRQRLAADLPGDAIEAVRDHYFLSYLRQWSQPELAPVLAAIPSLMMWDDHDIFDGWGSLRAELQDCAVYRAVWTCAREAFAQFQLGELPGRREHFGWNRRLGAVGIIAPDLRSERRRDRIMGEAGWRDLTAVLAQWTDCRHLILLSSVPVVHVDLGPLERILQFIPGQQSHQDDLRDQWQSPAHRAEWQRLLLVLRDFAAASGARITVVSGEIHLGARGVAEIGELSLHQLIASGVVHAPPPAAWTAFLELLARRRWRPFDEVRLRMLPIPGLGRRYLAARNWLALDLSADGALDATWNVIDAPAAYRVTMAAVG